MTGEVEVNEGWDLLRGKLPLDAVVVVRKQAHPHPPVLTAAADGSHTQGCMIALMPTAEGATRLAVPGGEPAEELHLTLFFLGDDAAAYGEDVRAAIVDEVTAYAAHLPPVTAKAFGAAHWNGDSWVWSVGDLPSGEGREELLEEYRQTAANALLMADAFPLVPEQYHPWAAHICAAYSDDPSFLPELEQRLGPVTFDRLRVSFGDEDHDVPLTGPAVTAAAGPLRREPTELELAARTDFAGVHAEWEAATAGAVRALKSTTAAWRLDLREQITRHLAADDPELLPDLTLPTLDATAVLRDLMEEFAVKAGRACQREAERQGVTVPDWSLPEDGDGPDALTAGIGGRRLLSSVAQLTSDLAASALVQAAKRKLSGLLRSSAPAERVAAEVDRELAAMDDSGVRASVGSAMTAAQNAGRHAVMEAAPPASSYVASEILDSRTCGPCKAIDGRTFTTLDAAVAEYPVMGYRDCTGARYGNACRGFIVAVWQEVRDPAPATTAAAWTSGGCVFHGTPGRPSYRKYHPSGRNKKPAGRTRHDKGGWLGSDRYSERDHEQALDSYTGNGYKAVNECLRKECPGSEAAVAQTRERISTLTDLISVQEQTTRETRVYRGVRGVRLDLAEGDEFHDKGFVSTTRDEDFAKNWIGGWGTIVRITAPSGTQMLDVESVGIDGSEGEVILPPGSKFRVTRAVVPEIPVEPVVLEVELING